MEDIHRTHKEPAWGWIGALLEVRKTAAPVSAKTARPARTATPAAVPARRAAC
ncbi:MULTISPECIES: hypothetical protein [unclassified Brevundimonas]|uniref:hypothetical protein n=1 Tax=unclassified Brevundimonas TaxID=2622653 RepID=UPI003F92C6D7